MFKKWLGKLYSFLAPKGLLVFSVHDQAVLPSDIAMPVTGFFFQPHSESRSLDKNQYGSTWVTEDFVRNVIVEITYNHMAWGPEGDVQLETDCGNLLRLPSVRFITPN